MAAEIQHRRTHNLLLINRILSCRDQVSPFTLILDSLQQSGWPLLTKIISRAKISKVHITFVSFETVRKPAQVDDFIPCHGKSHLEVQRLLTTKIQPSRKSLLIFDTLHPLLNQPTFSPAPFLGTLLSPSATIVALVHADVPVTAPANVYAADALTLLRYMATAILTTHSLAHTVARKIARDRSLAEPAFGLETGVDGVVVSAGSNSAVNVVVEMEQRRKSGRSVVEWFVVATTTATGDGELRAMGDLRGRSEDVVLLEDHAAYPKPALDNGREEGEGMDSTFNLGLTEEQRRDREKVVLPYFDAQKEGGGLGGRILYDMGAEDDFDEEEDEI
ncbi:hypothetical protein BT63DRAFT_422523 [Microthyrium microscopicum]|uniref:Elongator complex protein 5 n=1 Tax=Microthyrium microscopicum TaxID=703497 RepID=A0A6A6UKP0_9PEZI|nr:hypothetical protein BT63DRAFT_422523 [Microthyrium microscopicum]